ncbi:MAG: hypothetical protein IT377_12505 [Polyangiaceae bacterium]|nr:hypothetical protein [Polyangiaceae bacterium]
MLTVDPDTGQARVLGQWPRLGLFEQHCLRTDRDGAMLLFASSKKHQLDAVVRLELADGNLAPSGFRIRPRALALPPVVDAAYRSEIHERPRYELQRRLRKGPVPRRGERHRPHPLELARA